VSVAWTAYRWIAPALGALAPHASVFASPAERPLWRERMGGVRWEGGCDAWIHAASMGEAAAAGPLTRELSALDPAARLRLTATTRTGRTRLEALGLPVALAPIDAPQMIGRFLSAVRPARLFVIETEIWPHWLLAAAEHGVRVAFVSARLSDRSVAGYRRLGRPLARLLDGVEALLCQTEADAARWRSIGARPDRVIVTGNIKFDALPMPRTDRRAARLELGLDDARPLLTLGSVRPGEARVLAEAWLALPAGRRIAWQVVAVPRHARALAELLEEARSAGLDERREWRWDERPGVLNAYYAASDAAFVGASLVPLGGHSPLEPAAVGAAVIMGPHGSHQQQAVSALESRGAIAIAEPARFSAALAALLDDDALRARMSSAGVEVVRSLRGAARRSVAELAMRGLWPVPR
jgi:3-deoxy-D-manno-octulosonic-acid transferase